MMLPLVFTLTVQSVLPNADALFAEGNAEFKQGHFAEARALFERSHQLEPSLGALMNQGACLEKEGKLAAAVTKLTEAHEWATREKAARRVKTLEARLEKLRPRVGWLEVRPIGPVRGEVLVLAGEERTLEGPVRLPVEAGRSFGVVRAPGHLPWDFDVIAPSPGKTLVVSVPSLEPEPAVRVDDVPLFDAEPVVELPLPAYEPPLPPTVFLARVKRANPLAVGGVVTGGVLLVLGAAGLTWNFATADALARQQPGGPDALKPTVTRAQFETMQWSYPASWAALGVGAATTIASAVWLSRTSNVSLAPVPGGVSLQGRW